MLKINCQVVTESVRQLSAKLVSNDVDTLQADQKLEIVVFDWALGDRWIQCDLRNLGFCGVSQSILKQLPSCPNWYCCKGQAILTTAYRALHILNWVYRFFTENKIRWIFKFSLCFRLWRSLLTSTSVKMLKTAWVSGLIQTALYADFFYYYFRSWENRKKLKQPACVDQVLFH
ncbi:uncharacterized protein LOC116144765 [Pistacia vera]|uniref:uncharacterized protein LOC116144765 n=1 Tax=Pistacia vera TaxID=55513 RepID=UPI001263135C|nr:uncharacterized protein LOC116144765 [Pistacia vera]